MRARRLAARRVPAVAVAVVAVLGLAGCVGIPTSGPIGTGDVLVVEPGAVIPEASDPVPGATAKEIVGGFVNAGNAGVYDDFETARKFLTIFASAQWDPRARALVYAGGPEITEREDGTILVAVAVAATLDGSGRYTEAAPGARAESVFELVQDGNGQWRISGLEPGALISSATFQAYGRVPLYFATLDRQQLVPDVRWFPPKNTATLAVAALLEGPSPWLREGVRNGAPEGARASAVTVSDGVATVSLSAPAGTAEGADRDLLQAQLEATLTLGRIPGTVINDVQVTLGANPWPPSRTLGLERDVAPGAGPFVLQGDQLAVVDGRDVQPQEDAAPLTGLAANHPAVSFDGSTRVVLDGMSRLLLLPADAAPPVPLLTGAHLLPASIDRFNWAWTGEQVSPGSLQAVLSTGEVVTVAADWLQGRTIRSIRVSRDGARIAVVSLASTERQAAVDVFAVLRDADDRPQALGEVPMRIGTALSDADEVAWVDEGTVAVLGVSGTLSAPTVHLVPVGGPIQALSHRDGAANIAAGGNRALYLATSDMSLLSRQGESWVEVATGVRDPVFPG